jgi:uncharacterized protein YecT (DUF1311 family)
VRAIAALAACAPAARADELPTNEEGLRACVSAAGVERAALERCIGVSANFCDAEMGPAASVLCSWAEGDIWRELISETTSRLSQAPGDRDPALLVRANEAWSAWEEAECAYWSWEEGGGSGEQVDRAHCYARVSADRAIALIIRAGR